jgi:dTDP-glucose 4,6-dehydratase
MNVLHAFMELPDYKHRKIIAASTAEVYGLQRRNEPFSEECELRPSSPYAVSKAAAEMYLKMSAKVYGLNCTVLRPCNSYGRLNETGFVVEYLIYSMLRGSKVYVGAPNSIRDYIHIDDHTRAYLRIIQQETEPGAVYNVGSGQGISNRDLSFKIASKIGYDRSDIVLGAYPPEYPQRPITSDQPYLVLDASKIKSLGWTQEVSLDQGLDRSVAHWRPRVPDLR